MLDPRLVNAKLDLANLLSESKCYDKAIEYYTNTLCKPICEIISRNCINNNIITLLPEKNCTNEVFENVANINDLKALTSIVKLESRT